MTSINETALANQNAARRTNGKFGHQGHGVPGVSLTAAQPVNEALTRTISEMTNQLALMITGAHKLTDSPLEREVDLHGAARQRIYRETRASLTELQESGLSDGEKVEALHDLGRGLKQGSLGHLADELLLTAFELREARQLAGWTGISEHDGLRFEDTMEPETDAEAAALHRYAARLKLSGISGTIRGARVTGRNADSFDAIIEDAEGRGYELVMGGTHATIFREDGDLMDEFKDLQGESTVSIESRSPVTPAALAEGFQTVRRATAVTNAWLRSGGPVSNNGVRYSSPGVFKSGSVEGASIMVEQDGLDFLVTRMHDRSTGTAEVRIHSIDMAKPDHRMTSEILAGLSAAGGGPAEAEKMVETMDKFLDAALKDPAVRSPR